ncbi:glycosyltransferase [Glycomyces sp. MUSA5-2]|uniref:glycosyltransferase n=1 Tax=Glycomyces sp. MUSA5-2 TaxID=2053002 RepID=UPI0030082D97
MKRAARRAKALVKRTLRLGPVPFAAAAGLAAAVLAAAVVPDRQSALAVAVVVVLLELGLVAVLLARLLRALKEAAVAAPEPVEPAKPARTAAPGRLPARKLRPLRRWTARLNNGFSATALPEMYRYARNEKGTYLFRAAMLGAIVDWRERRRREAAEPVRGRFDIVLVSNLNLLGGTTASNAEEVKAYRDAGLTVGLLHHPVYEWNVARDVNPKISELVDGERVVMLGPGDEVDCDLMIVRFPPLLMRLMDDRPSIKAAKAVLLVNQTPFEAYGPDGTGRHFSWDVAAVRDNLKSWVGDSTWYAIGPSVREALETHHGPEMAGVDLADDYWYGSLDPDRWRRDGPREADGTIRIGRHSRDHALKWQTIAEDLRATYPDAEDMEIHVLGGTDAPERVLGRLPGNWTGHPFGSVEPEAFLHGLDVAVYFTAEDYVEAFGRSPMEAMAAGLPCVMPPRFEPLFGDGGVYCEPEEVEAVVRALMEPGRYREQSERSLATVREHFSHEALLRRVAELGVEVQAR